MLGKQVGSRPRSMLGFGISAVSYVQTHISYCFPYLHNTNKTATRSSRSTFLTFYSNSHDNVVKGKESVIHSLWISSVQQRLCVFPQLGPSYGACEQFRFLPMI